MDGFEYPLRVWTSATLFRVTSAMKMGVRRPVFDFIAIGH
jgi:hypothetical protein